MLLYLLFLLTVIIILAFLEKHMGREKWYIYNGLCIILVLTSGLRPIGFDPDSETYETNFQNAGTPFADDLIEYSFHFFSTTAKSLFNNIHTIFLFYALLAIPLKFYAIKRTMPWVFLPLVIYFCGFYLLHDSIQMRASVASSMLLLSIKPLSEGRRWIVSALFLIALFFHYSSLMLFAVILFRNKQLSGWWRIGLASLVPLGAILYILHIDLIATLPIPYIQEKMEDYEQLKEQGIFDEISILNVIVWVRISVFLYALYFYDTIKSYCSFLPLLLKIMGLSVFSFFALSNIPILSERVNEMFGIVEIFLIPYIYYTIRPQYAARIFICFIAIVDISYRFFRLETFNFIDF